MTTKYNRSEVLNFFDLTEAQREDVISCYYQDEKEAKNDSFVIFEAKKPEYNAAQNRVETSKGVQIPAEIAKRAYYALNGCLNQSCNDLSIPVLDYTIEKTTETALIAGCHTIPKTDVQYIAKLLKW